jgi:hypothetical protein
LKNNLKDYLFISNILQIIYNMNSIPIDPAIVRDGVIGAVAGSALFAGYLELSPKIGKIWIRNGEFMPGGLVQFFKYPFNTENGWIWKPANWDLNWIAWSTGGMITTAALGELIRRVA